MALFTTDGQIGALKDVLVAAINGRVKKSGDTMAGALSLIAPTANAHAARKQDVDGRVAKTGDTMTGDLTISKANPSVFLIDSAGISGRQRVLAQLLGSSGQVRVMWRNDDGSAGSNIFTVDNTGMRVWSSLAAGRPTAAGQVPQLNAYDPATGRRLVDGVEEGWTGWRRLVSWTGGVQDAANQSFTINTTAFALVGTGALDLRRDGNRCMLRTGPQSITPTATGAPFLANSSAVNVIPSGFRADVDRGWTTLANDKGADLVIRNEFNGALRMGVWNLPSAALADWMVAWDCTSVWPSILPGTAVAGSTPYQLPAAA